MQWKLEISLSLSYLGLRFAGKLAFLQSGSLYFGLDRSTYSLGENYVSGTLPERLLLFLKFVNAMLGKRKIVFKFTLSMTLVSSTIFVHFEVSNSELGYVLYFFPNQRCLGSVGSSLTSRIYFMFAILSPMMGRCVSLTGIQLDVACLGWVREGWLREGGGGWWVLTKLGIITRVRPGTSITLNHSPESCVPCLDRELKTYLEYLIGAFFGIGNF